MKKKLKWIIAGLVAVAAGTGLYTVKNGSVEAETLKVSKGEIKQYVEETAQVLLRDKQTVYIEGSGKIVDINVDVGDAVKQGDLLLSLEKTDLELQLKDAEAGIEASRAQLKGTELINYANKIELAKIALTQAENAYASAKRNLESAKKLYESEALSKEELDKAQDAYNSAAASLDSARLQLEDVKSGAPEHLKNSYKAQLEQAVIRRDTILRNIRKQEVRAPIDGIVIEKLVERNSFASPSTPAFVIGDVNKVELQAEVLSDDANKIKAGNEVEISGKAIDDTLLKGKVTKIAPAAKTVTSALGINQKRVQVTIEITDRSDLIKPGYELDVKIITSTKNNAIKVPDSSVFDYKGESCVFIVKNGRAFIRAVKKGIESGDFIEIAEGLNEGDTILVKPDNNIREGIRIKFADKAAKKE